MYPLIIKHGLLETGPCINDFPFQTSSHSGFSIAIFDCRTGYRVEDLRSPCWKFPRARSEGVGPAGSDSRPSRFLHTGGARPADKTSPLSGCLVANGPPKASWIVHWSWIPTSSAGWIIGLDGEIPQGWCKLTISAESSARPASLPGSVTAATGSQRESLHGSHGLGLHHGWLSDHHEHDPWLKWPKGLGFLGLRMLNMVKMGYLF